MAWVHKRAALFGLWVLAKRCKDANFDCGFLRFSDLEKELYEVFQSIIMEVLESTQTHDEHLRIISGTEHHS